MSPTTKKFKTLSIVFFILEISCTFIPIIVFLLIGAFSGEVGVFQKFTLGIGSLVALVIGIMGLIVKKHWRTPLWVFVLICYLALVQFGAVLITFGICTFVEELIFTPLHNRYAEAYRINKQIDIRESKK